MLTRERPSEAGVTLVEMLVSLVVGTVIIFALFSVLDGVLHQSSRTLTKVDATASARTALAALEGELQSACLTGGVAPLQPGSTGSMLTFLSAYGNAAQPTPVEHQVSYSSSTGALTDSLYAVSGGAAPNWTFSSSPYQTTTLLSNVAQSSTTPVFQYFAYQQVANGSGGYYTDGAGNAYMMLLDGTSSVPGTSPAVIPAVSPLTDAAPSGLSSTDAQSAAEVLITLGVGAGGGTPEETGLPDAGLTVTDSIVLRMTPPPNNVESGASFSPCT